MHRDTATGYGECAADRAARITRDTGPSAALSGRAAYASTAATPPPCGRTSLTRSRAGASPNPIRVTVRLGAKTRRKGIQSATRFAPSC